MYCDFHDLIGGRNNGQVTVIVPQKNFYQTIEQIETLGTINQNRSQGRTLPRSSSTQALGFNLKRQEARLQEILRMANTVKEVLEVKHELERVRE